MKNRVTGRVVIILQQFLCPQDRISRYSIAILVRGVINFKVNQMRPERTRAIRKSPGPEPEKVRGSISGENALQWSHLRAES